MTLKLPAHVVERARALASGGEWEVPAARDAATVVLVRDAADGIEVCLLRRSLELPFAPGVHVFPGGAVDKTDYDQTVQGDVAAARFTSRPEVAAALVVCAVRETFEEVGVLIGAGTGEANDSWAADRGAAEASGIAPILERRGVRVDATALRPIAHWVTPEIETRRYDTRFLLAAMPEGQHVAVDGSEIVAGVWVAPKDAVAGADSGEYPILPPTRAVLEMLREANSVAAAFAIADTAEIRPLMPHPVTVGDDLAWVLIDAYTREPLSEVSMPAGSEVEGKA